MAVLIDRPPQIVMLTLNRQKHLIHMPLVAGPRTPATELIRILLTTLAAPLAEGLRRHDHSAFQQQLFHITEAQAEPKIQPHGVADDLCRKPMVLIARGWGYGAHAATLSYGLGVEQVAKAGDGHGDGGDDDKNQSSSINANKINTYDGGGDSDDYTEEGWEVEEVESEQWSVVGKGEEWKKMR